MALGRQFQEYFGLQKRYGGSSDGLLGARLEGAKGYRAKTRQMGDEGFGELYKTTLGIPTKRVGAMDWQRPDGVLSSLNVEAGHEIAVKPWLQYVNSKDAYGPKMADKNRKHINDFLEA
jgi:hypothetical protein